MADSLLENKHCRTKKHAETNEQAETRTNTSINTRAHNERQQKHAKLFRNTQNHINIYIEL